MKTTLGVRVSKIRSILFVRYGTPIIFFSKECTGIGNQGCHGDGHILDTGGYIIFQYVKVVVKF